jgi:hypothetical protein
VLTKMRAVVGIREEQSSARERQSLSSSTIIPWRSAPPKSRFAASSPVPRAPRDSAYTAITVRSPILMIG